MVACRLLWFMKLNSAQLLVGPALVTTKDAGDAVTLLQSLAGSTFDSSQLVLTACMGYQNVNETRLQELRNKHRPAVIVAIEERSKGLQAWKDSQGLASKLYNFKQDPKSMIIETKKAERNGDLSRSESGSTNADEILISLTGDGELDSVPDLQDQVGYFFVYPGDGELDSGFTNTIYFFCLAKQWRMHFVSAIYSAYRLDLYSDVFFLINTPVYRLPINLLFGKEKKVL